MTSIGCPYDCGFCVDWNSKFVALDRDRLLADLRFLSENHPKLIILFHDPNFGIRFDETMEVIEQIPKGRRNRYVMEASLSVLKPERFQRLADTNCLYAAPGVESWTEYSGKAGTGKRTGREKLEKIIAQFDLLGRYVPGLRRTSYSGRTWREGSDSLTSPRSSSSERRTSFRRSTFQPLTAERRYTNR